MLMILLNTEGFYMDTSNKTETPEEKEAFDVMAQDIEQWQNAEMVGDEPQTFNVANLALKAEAAMRTLDGLGYTWNGGEQWKPPLGEKPKWLDNGGWKNGDNLLWQSGDMNFLPVNTGRYIGFDSVECKHIFARTDIKGYAIAYANEDGIRKPETPEQKEERLRQEKVSDICEDLFGLTDSECRDDVVATVYAMVVAGYEKKEQ